MILSTVSYPLLFDGVLSCNGVIVVGSSPTEQISYSVWRQCNKIHTIVIKNKMVDIARGYIWYGVFQNVTCFKFTTQVLETKSQYILLGWNYVIMFFPKKFPFFWENKLGKFWEKYKIVPKLSHNFSQCRWKLSYVIIPWIVWFQRTLVGSNIFSINLTTLKLANTIFIFF